ncbi:hypothetical protein H0H92_011971, partial [Tricholoma furcatifolium]
AELSIFPPCLVYVRIHGGRETFSALGIHSINDTNGEKDLRFVTACAKLYGVHVVGGKELYNLVQPGPESGRTPQISKDEGLACAKARDRGVRRAVAYINGGYYNRFNPNFPNCTADIGTELPYVPPPLKYIDKYHTLPLTSHAALTSAPLLARNGAPTFTDADMRESRFRYNASDITPGLLNHAEHPNPRAALVVPGNVNGSQRHGHSHYRLAVAVATTNPEKRGSEGTGFTMVEWARVGAWLSKRGDLLPGSDGEEEAEAEAGDLVALNLDGGASTVLGIDVGGQEVLGVRSHREPRVPYLVVLAPRKGIGLCLEGSDDVDNP